MFNYKSRLSKLKQELHKQEIDAFIVTDIKNIFYLTGFTGSCAVLVVFSDNRHNDCFYTDARYDKQAHLEVCEEVSVRVYTRELYKELVSYIKNINIKNVSLEANAMVVALYEFIKKELDNKNIIPKAGIIEDLRLIKETVEIDLIKSAIKIAENSYNNVLEKISSGMREKDFANKLEYEMKAFDADDISFRTIVASGVNSAMPHFRTSDKKLENGDVVVVDYGCVYKGYVSDITRTIFVKEVINEIKIYYDILRDVQEEVLQKIKPGIIAKDLDLGVRKELSKFNLEKYFLHSLGHGLGIDVHEYPNINSNSEVVLKENMIFTIEPGIYIEDKWGMRIEDIVLVTSDGAEVLTSLSKEVFCLGM
jgi:Xaa-Pro aminopeptidase